MTFSFLFILRFESLFGEGSFKLSDCVFKGFAIHLGRHFYIKVVEYQPCEHKGAVNHYSSKNRRVSIYTGDKGKQHR